MTTRLLGRGLDGMMRLEDRRRIGDSQGLASSVPGPVAGAL
jgi:hypothetical protein